jgi:hypothetical protein
MSMRVCTVHYFSECRDTANLASRLYAERFPERQHADLKLFLQLGWWLRENGQLAPVPRINVRRNRHVRTPENEDRVVAEVNENQQKKKYDRYLGERDSPIRLYIWSM